MTYLRGWGRNWGTLAAAGAITWFAPSALAQEAAPRKPDPAREWRPLMDRFQLGEADAALAGFRQMALDCGGSESDICTDEGRSIIYGCIGIILATEGEHNHSVQAFRKALTLNSAMTILPELQSEPVLRAYREAKGESQPTAAPAPATAPPTGEAPDESAEEENEDDGEQSPHREPKGRFLVLATAYGYYGSLHIYDGFNLGEAFKGSGGVVIGGMPGETSGFTMGIRARGSVYAYGEALGAMSLQFALGGTIGPRRDKRFSYFLGEFGAEYFPALSGSSFLASFQGGTSLGGFALGGGVDVSGGTHGFYAGLGLEVGYGGLY